MNAPPPFAVSPQHAPQVRRALRWSIYEGALAQVFSNLTGGIFLPAFALALGAGAPTVGALASLPLLASMTQFAGAYLVERAGRCRPATLAFAAAARLAWLPLILLTAVWFDRRPVTLLTLLIATVVIHHLLLGIAGVAWASWMRALVPDEVRGRFFGLRNALLGGTGMLVTIGGGYLLDHHGLLPGGQAAVFAILFGAALACGTASLALLARIPEPVRHSDNGVRFRRLLLLALRHRDYTRLLRFGAAWSFGVHFSGPFFLVYMLRYVGLTNSHVAWLVTLAAAADLAGMVVWGHFSDRLGNRPLILLNATIAATFPLWWLLSGPDAWSHWVLIPLLHLAGGFFWSGYNLCSANLLYRLAPAGQNAVYFAGWAACTGAAAGCGALAGGALCVYSPAIAAQLGLGPQWEFKLVFLLSGLLRIGSLAWLRAIHEPRGVPFVRAVRVLLDVRSWATVMGFNTNLHTFIPTHEAQYRSGAYWPLWRRTESEASTAQVEMPRRQGYTDRK